MTRSAGDAPTMDGPAGSDSPAVPLSPLPFVGREAEVARLTALIGAAAAGTPQLVLIQGPAGIGKTRLAEEAGERARMTGGRVAFGRCWPDAEAPPLWPWRAVLRELGASDSVIEDRLEKPQGRFARFQAVLQHLRGVAGRPLVIILDDAHLADAASLLLARFMVRERTLPLLLLLTCREPSEGGAYETAELLSDLGADAEAVALAGLSEESVGEYLRALGTPPTDSALVHTVAAITGGNPLHLRAMSLQSRLASGGVTGSLERAIRRLLERLPVADRRVIALCALLGPEVSPHEAARLVDAPPSLVLESLANAAELGLAVTSGADRYRFLHDLVRGAASSSLSVAERLEVHARAARLLTGEDPASLARRAHHALEAASRSRDDAERAVQVAREAARGLRAVDGFEPAAFLLGRAVEIHGAAGLAGSAADLRVERAEAVLACGRLAESRPLFEDAARTAQSEGEPVALARAALGLGGLWLSEHRLASEAERTRFLQRKALMALPAEEHVLRARLEVRLAAEEAYRGGDLAAVLEGVEAVRGTSNTHALADALSLAHHALMAPEHTWRRLALAREMTAAATASQDGLLALVALCWQTADLFLLGDPRSTAALADLRCRAEALGCRAVLFIAHSMEVMLAIRGGRFAAAEGAARACFALGTEAGDADAPAYQAAHLAAIRVFQGREAELADLAADMASSPTLIGERERAFASAAALFALRAGRPQAGAALLERLRRDGIASFPASSSWLPAMAAVVELAAALSDVAVAQAAYDALLPYADLPAMGSLAVICLGSVHRPLGLAAVVCGRHDLAVEHLAAALAANDELGHRPAALQAQAELGLARLRRVRHGDPRGRALLEEAIDAAETAEMGGLAARWRQAAAEIPGAESAADALAILITRSHAGRWRVVLGREVAVVPDRVGMGYLVQLVAAPDRGIPALTLVVQGAIGPRERPAGPVIDRRALGELRERIRVLQAENRLSPGEEEELAGLREELGRVTGFGGRTRSFADAPERARTAVRKALKRAVEEIVRANPVVGRHLEQRIETGSICRYRLGR